MTEEITEAIRNAFNEYLNAVDKILLENQALQIELKRLEQERDELKKACEKCKLFDIEKTNRDLLEQIEKLEQENKDLKKQIESDKGLITVGGKQQYEMTMAYDKCKSALEDIQKAIKSYDLAVDNGASVDTLYTIRKIINEVLNDSEG